ncbi:MAG: VacJ family lipoprotein, partial [Bdellovibrionales bacterium]|nr:VacJ family lipoprotein [Bdellovibrionales bacterium]
MPDEVKVKVSNFFDNLLSIRNIPNALVQFKFKQTFRETGRFLTNSTLGLAGLFDVASEFGLEEQTGEDFGVTMAYYGMPSGPYIVLPFLGPSNLRDAVGKGVDFFTSPPYILQHVGLSQGQENSIIYSYIGVDAIQTRYSLLDAIEAGKEASIDYYLFAQSAYYQNREGKLYDGNPPSKALSEDELLNDDDF